MDDSEREGHNDLTYYLVNEALVNMVCLDYEDGLFAKGLAQAIGNFHQKFADLKISIDNPLSPTSTLAFLTGTSADNLTSQATTRILSVLLSS